MFFFTFIIHLILQTTIFWQVSVVPRVWIFQSGSWCNCFFFFTPIQSELSLWPLVTTCMWCRQFDRFLFINFSLYVPLQASWTMFTSRVQTTNYNPNQINNIHGCKQQVATQFWSFGRSKQIYTWHITLILYKQDKKHLLVICFPVSHLHCVHFAKVSVTQKTPHKEP